MDDAARIAALAEDLRRSCDRGSGVPDLSLLASDLGVRVRYFPLGDLKGFYLLLEDIPFIVLNQTLPEPVLRIVCAHEFGHHLLHRELAGKTVFNEYELYQMENKLEREANLFAAFLLIPDSAVRAFREPEQRGRSVGETARLLGTTEELFAIRLRAEGLPADIRLSRFPTE